MCQCPGGSWEVPGVMGGAAWAALGQGYEQPLKNRIFSSHQHAILHIMMHLLLPLLLPPLLPLLLPPLLPLLLPLLPPPLPNQVASAVAAAVRSGQVQSINSKSC